MLFYKIDAVMYLSPVIYSVVVSDDFLMLAGAAKSYLAALPAVTWSGQSYLAALPAVTWSGQILSGRTPSSNVERPNPAWQHSQQ